MSTLLGDILPLGSLWERHGQPRQRCARKEDESPKPPNLRGGSRVNKVIRMETLSFVEEMELEGDQ